METIGNSRLQTFLSTGWTDSKVTNSAIRGDRGLRITSFPSLVEKVASLTFYNRDQVLLFRGQSADYRNSKNNTTLQPLIFRGRRGKKAALWNHILWQRYERLRIAEELLVKAWAKFDLPDRSRIERHRNLRWTILQHYGICATPLIDVTQSLRVAASFALESPASEYAVVYILGVPQISGSITASAEAELQMLRLSSVCPPTARRPHYQEGYLLGHYPDLQSPDEKQHYQLYEVDFARRLLCKFRIIKSSKFWRTGFPAVPHHALYPNKRDMMVKVAEAIGHKMPEEI